MNNSPFGGLLAETGPDQASEIQKIILDEPLDPIIAPVDVSTGRKSPLVALDKESISQKSGPDRSNNSSPSELLTEPDSDLDPDQASVTMPGVTHTPDTVTFAPEVVGPSQDDPSADLPQVPTRQQSASSDSTTSPQDGLFPEKPYLTENADLPDHILTPVDKLLDEVYGDHIHQNDGRHLDGGVQDDGFWQNCWKVLVPLPSSKYDVPRGPIGRRFIDTLEKELRGIMSGSWNSERFLVFQMTVLQKAHGIIRARDIKTKLSQRLDAWEAGKWSMLVEDAERQAHYFLHRKQGTSSEEERSKTFKNMVLRGKLRSAVRWITDRESGGVLYPQDQ